VLVAKRTRCKNAVTGLLAQYNVAEPEALPALPRFQCARHAEQRALLTAQTKRLERQLLPTLVPDADVQRLLWIPGIGKTAAFTLHLEIGGIERVPDVRAFFSSCRLVPGAKNSGGRTRHGARERAHQGRRPPPEARLRRRSATPRSVRSSTSLYYPEIQTWYRQRLRTKGAMIARALVAKELARIVYRVLGKRQDFDGLFKGTTLSRTKKVQWPVDGPPRTPSPAAELAPGAPSPGATAVAHDWDGIRPAVDHRWDSARRARHGVWTPLLTSAAEMPTGWPLPQPRTTTPPAEARTAAPGSHTPPCAPTP
jgi:hypothetical protein